MTNKLIKAADELATLTQDMLDDDGDYWVPYVRTALTAYRTARNAREAGLTRKWSNDLPERLRDNCNGTPASIQWPHRILHEAAEEIEECWRNIGIKADWIVAKLDELVSGDDARKAGEVAVKPLVFSKVGADWHCYSNIGLYLISPMDGGWCGVWFPVSDPEGEPDLIEDGDCIAIAAAQADYETRIRSALEE